MSHAAQLAQQPVHIKTPLIYSDILSAKLNSDIYLKLEHLQPAYSFKQRTLGALVRSEVQTHGPSVHIVLASSGNGALAGAHAAQQLGVKCSVFISLPSYRPYLIEILERYGAKPNGVGDTYPEALEAAKEFVKNDPNAVLLSTYDHPKLWQGASSMIDEIAEQLPSGAAPPDVIVCNVGGGSTLGGVLIGCDNHGWNDTRILALETTGSDAFYFSVLGSENSSYAPPSRVQLVDVPAPSDPTSTLKKAVLIPTSKATSLGASSPAVGVLEHALTRRKRDKNLLTCADIPDELPMRACLGFADDHKTLVELAGGATLAPAYSSVLFSKLFPSESSSAGDESTKKKLSIVFIVCGGFKATLADMTSYQTWLEQKPTQGLDAWVEEDQFVVDA